MEVAMASLLGFAWEATRERGVGLMVMTAA
jgi:hypothetical protein